MLNAATCLVNSLENNGYWAVCTAYFNTKNCASGSQDMLRVIFTKKAGIITELVNAVFWDVAAVENTQLLTLVLRSRIFLP
jgi:hypothetical protein